MEMLGVAKLVNKQYLCEVESQAEMAFIQMELIDRKK